MPLAIIAGLAFLALEIAAIAWLLHWLLAGTVSLLVLSGVIVIALLATILVWASLGVADHADDEMESFMAASDGQSSTECDGAVAPTNRKKQSR